MMRFPRLLAGILLAVSLLFSSQIIAQRSNPDTLVAYRIDKAIRLDGVLDEPAWKEAVHISNFTQVEPQEGLPASERTEVAVIYTETALYIGLWCYYKDPKTIVAKFLERDFDVEADDIIAIGISPFNDKRTGYALAVNANGARADGLIEGPEDVSLDWNGVWDAMVKRNTEGWFAEIYIPFSTLQYRQEGSGAWGIQFQRHILHNNEIVRWQGWSRNYNFENMSQAGTLVGLENIRGKLRLELKPYALLGVTKEKDIKADGTHKVGIDINKNLLSTLKLNLTVNTDFAQVESDRIQTNLSRFSLFYPEKREFFLEGANNYSFSLGGPNNLFYSRRIGINDNNEQVPILGGARVFGKAGNTNIGFLSIQSRGQDENPSTNYSMLRLRQDVGRQSNVGIIMTSVQREGYSNLVFGGDAVYETSEFLKNKNLSIGGMLYGSDDSETENERNIGYRFFVDYPNDLLDLYVSTTFVPENFIPGMGFTFRSNYRNYVSFFRFTPRWFTKIGVRKMNFQPWRLFLYQDAATGEVESWEYGLRPFGFELQSGESFELNFNFEYDHPENDFELSDGLVVPAGEYNMRNVSVEIETFSGRRLVGQLEFQAGTFYTGDIESLTAGLSFNVNKHLNVSSEWRYNHVSLPEGDIFSHELSGRAVYAFTPRLNASIFAQWNSEEDFIGYNFRVHWIPKIGSDFYLVFNQGYDEKLRFKRLQETSSGLKLVWRIAI
ncbi:MAG: hypothetical protein CMJ42_16790 [Phyllobacteriaceae bacterium]|nr:hypothetical protein [Phyllobacteriaceae bacterium]